MSLTDEIRQIAINLADRIHKLEVHEPVQPISVETTPYQDSIALAAVSATPLDGADNILEPGLYAIHGHFDFEAGSSGGGLTDEAFLATGQLVVNGQVMPGVSIMKLLSVLGSDAVRRGMRAVVSESWVLSLWDYKQAVLQDNPSLFLRLDDNSAVGTLVTRARDRSRNGLSGTYNGGMVRLQPGPLQLGLDRVPSYAIQFNGSSANIASSIFNPSSASGTLEIWFKTSVAVVQPLIANSDITTHRSGVALYLNAAGNLVLDVASAAAVTTLTGTAVLNDNAWHHAVGTFDGTTLRLYVDGQFDVSVAQGGVTPTAENTVTIGMDQGGSPLFFNGYLAEPAYYSATILRPNRVLFHYQVGVSEYLPTTYYKQAVRDDLAVRYYRLGDATAVAMTDSSGGNFNGTYTNVSLNQPGGIMIDPDGIYDKSAKFDGFYGGSSTASGPDTGMPSGNSDRTLEAWIYLTETPALVPPVRAIISGYGTAGVADQAWYLSVISTLVLRFSTDGADVNGTTVLQLRRWYHVAVKNVGNNVTIYLDGDVEATGMLTINTVLSGLTYIGNFPVANRAFVGLIDEVSWTASALSDARIRERYRIGRSNRAFITLAAYKTGGTDISAIHNGGTKLIVTKLQSLTKS